MPEIKRGLYAAAIIREINREFLLYEKILYDGAAFGAGKI